MSLLKQKIEWEKIYNDLSPKILGVCRKYVKNVETAEDIMHETFITAINKIDTYSGRGSLNGWITTIAVNNSLLYLRNHKKREFLLDEINASDDIIDNLDDKNIENSILKVDFDETELLETIDSLPEHHKIVFNLYVFEGFNHQQIGKKLGISTGTSKSHLSRARRKLQTLLHEKAMQKHNKQKDKNYFALILFSKTNYIDKLYREKLSSLHITPSNSTVFLKNLSPLTKSTLIPKFSILFVSKIVVVSLLMATGGYLYNINLSKKTTPNTIVTEQKSTIISKPIQENKNTQTNSDAQNKENDTSYKSNNQDKNSVEKTKAVIKKDTLTKLSPVIIHKQIIVRDTIYKSKQE